MLRHPVRRLVAALAAVALFAGCVTSGPQPPIVVETPALTALPLSVPPANVRVRVNIERWLRERQVYLPGAAGRTLMIGPAQAAALEEAFRRALGPDVSFGIDEPPPAGAAYTIDVKYNRAVTHDLLGPGIASPSLATSLRAVEIEYELSVKDVAGRLVNVWKFRGAAPPEAALLEVDAWTGAYRNAIGEAASRIAATGRALLSAPTTASAASPVGATVTTGTPILPTPLSSPAGNHLATPITVNNTGARPLLVLRDHVELIVTPGVEGRRPEHPLDFERNLRRFQETSPWTRDYHRGTGMSTPGAPALEIFLTVLDMAKTGGGRVKLNDELAPVVGNVLDDLRLKPGESATAYALHGNATRIELPGQVRLRVPVIDAETGAITVHEIGLPTPQPASGS